MFRVKPRVQSAQDDLDAAAQAQAFDDAGGAVARLSDLLHRGIFLRVPQVAPHAKSGTTAAMTRMLRDSFDCASPPRIAPEHEFPHQVMIMTVLTAWSRASTSARRKFPAPSRSPL
jgi:hypothetical protein